MLRVFGLCGGVWMCEDEEEVFECLCASVCMCLSFSVVKLTVLEALLHSWGAAIHCLQGIH